jgi:hypothetical protein
MLQNVRDYCLNWMVMPRIVGVAADVASSFEGVPCASVEVAAVVGIAVAAGIAAAAAAAVEEGLMPIRQMH